MPIGTLQENTTGAQRINSHQSESHNSAQFSYLTHLNYKQDQQKSNAKRSVCIPLFKYDMAYSHALHERNIYLEHTYRQARNMTHNTWEK